MHDRALQALVKLSLEPEWEAKFEGNSYGFRPGRSCHDAVAAIFDSIRYVSKYVLDADISKCFDQINHEALLRKVGTFPKLERVLKAWLKSGGMKGGTLFPTEEGTPQGGVISPLLANIALHGLETRIKENYPEFIKVNGIEYTKGTWRPEVIRYADDSFILHRDPRVIQECNQVAEEWLQEMGLELKPSKTRIAHTLEEIEGTRDLNFYQPDQNNRVRLVKRADGYYCQFAISVDREETLEPTGQAVGLDVGLNSFSTDSEGIQIENPRFYRAGEAKMTRAQRLVSRKKKGSGSRRKAINQLSRTHLKISRQRKDHACKLARSVITSHDVVVYEDLRVTNLVKNHCLAKSINDAGWYQFKVWMQYFAKVFGRLAIPVNPVYTSQECSECGMIVKKSLSTRTQVCQCGCKLDRDHNAAINILNKGLSTLGHKEIYAWGEKISTMVGAILP